MGTDFSFFEQMIKEGSISNLTSSFQPAADGSYLGPIDPGRSKDIGMIVDGIAASMHNKNGFGA